MGIIRIQLIKPQQLTKSSKDNMQNEKERRPRTKLLGMQRVNGQEAEVEPTEEAEEWPQSKKRCQSVTEDSGKEAREGGHECHLC